MNEDAPSAGISVAALLLVILALSSAGFSLFPSVPSPPDALIDVLKKSDVIYGITAFDRSELVAVSEAYDLDVKVQPPPSQALLGGPVITHGEHEAPAASLDLEKRTLDGWSVYEADSYYDVTGFPRLSRARVSIRKAGESEPCKLKSDGAFQCGDAGWMYVGPTSMKIGGARQECIWAHPLPGATTEIRYPPVATPSKGQWTVDFALADAAVGTRSPVKVVARYGEKRLRHTHSDRKGWSSLKLPATNRPAPVTLEISAPKTGRRHFCYRIRHRAR